MTVSAGRPARSGFLRGVTYLLSGAVGAQLIALVSIPMLTRLYDVREFAHLAVFMVVVGVVGASSTLGYTSMVLIPSGQDEAALVAHGARSSAIVVGIVLGFVALVFSVVVAPAHEFGLHGFGLVAAVAAGTGTALMGLAQAWWNRERRYGRIARVRGLQALLTAVIGVALGLVGVGDGLLWAQVAPVLLAVVAVASLPSQPSSGTVRQALRRHWQAPRYTLPTILLDVGSQSLPVFAVVAWFGATAGGQFSLAWRALVLPVSLVSVAVGQVFFERFASMVGDPVGQLSLLGRTWAWLCVVGVVPTLTVLMGGRPLFASVFGPSWGSAGELASAMAPMLLAMFVSSPTSSAFLVLGMQRASMYFGIAVLIYRPALLVIGLAVDDLRLALVLWSVAEMVQVFVYNALVVGRLRGRRLVYREQ